MGTSVITIRITGNHGCQRNVKDREKTEPMCENGEMCARACVDALARKAVAMLAAAGSINEAYIMHWPEAGPRIVDDLKTGERSGNF